MINTVITKENRNEMFGYLKSVKVDPWLIQENWFDTDPERMSDDYNTELNYVLDKAVRYGKTSAWLIEVELM